MALRVLCDLDEHGGFTAVDLETGISAYAYPTSILALAAKKQPIKTARRMIKAELMISHLHTGEIQRRDRERETLLCGRNNLLMVAR